MRVTLLAVAIVVVAVAVVATCAPGEDDAHETPTTALRGEARAPSDATPSDATTPKDAPNDRDAARSRRRAEAADATDFEPPFGAGYAISGTVRAPDGTPQPGALVLLGDLDDAYGATTSDEVGRFVLDLLPSYSRLHAIARVDGRTLTGSAAADGGPFVYDIELGPRAPHDGVRLLGIVDAEERPVLSARVTVLSDDYGEESVELRVLEGAAGVVAMADRVLPDSIRALIIDDAIGVEGALAPRLVTWWYPNVATATSILAPGHAIAGRVESPRGEPAPGVEIELRPPGPDDFDSDHMSMPELHTTTDEHGAFRFDGLAEGTGRLVIAGKPGVHGGVHVWVKSGDEGLVVPLRAEWRLRLRVRDEAGEPIETATIGSLAGRKRNLGGGELVLDGLPAGAKIDASVWAPGFVPVDIDRDSAPPEEPIEITMLREVLIRGRAWGPDGRPLAHVRLRVTGAPRWSDVSWHDDGSFEIPRLPPGYPPVEIRFAHAAGEGRGVSALPGDDDVELVWPPEERLVLLLPPRPGDDAVEVVVRRDGVELARTKSRRVTVPKLSDATGTVDVLIGPDSAGNVALLRELPARGFHRVEWEEAYELRNTVRRTDGLDPGRLHGVIRTEGGFEIPFRTRADGSFVVRGVPGGVHEVEINAVDLRAHNIVDMDQDPGDAVFELLPR